MHNVITKIHGNLKIGTLLFAFYLALCSNLFATVIIIAFIGAQLLVNLVNQDKKKKNWLWTYIKQNICFIIIVFFWLIIQLIEVNGLRAAYSNMNTPILKGTIEATKNFVRLHFNLRFTALAIISVVSALGYAYFRRKEDWPPIRKKIVTLVLAFILDIVYLILLCSRVNPLYMQQGQVIFSYSFFILIIVILSISYLCATIKYVKVGLPLITFLLFFEANTTGKAFRDVQYEYIDNPQACMDLNRILLDKIQKADLANQDSILITVPDFGNWDNWPLSYNCSKVGIVLYKHNIISRPIRTIYRRSGVVHQISEPFYAD